MLESTQLSNVDRPNYTILSYPIGGTSGGRTRDLLFAGQVLSQLSYSPINTEIGVEPIYPVYETGKTTSLPSA